MNVVLKTTPCAGPCPLSKLERGRLEEPGVRIFSIDLVYNYFSAKYSR
jgi:hypothetical protein